MVAINFVLICSATSDGIVVFLATMRTILLVALLIAVIFLYLFDGGIIFHISWLIFFSSKIRLLYGARG